jgi:aminoglycoside phosphotransferase (APT) family kinase protein
MPASPELMLDADAVQNRLAVYLGATVGSLRVLASGWETRVFEFVLASLSTRQAELPIATPLVLRFYQGAQADAKSARESVTMRLLAGACYPVPRPYLFEPDHDPLGAPFLIMERLEGGPLFATRSFPQAFKTFSLGFIGFVRAQADLHRIGTTRLQIDDIPQAHTAAGATNATPLLDRLLAIIADRIERGPLPGLQDALARLREDAARFRDSPNALVHMDYHPRNVIVKGTRVCGVIDWVNADRGDRHLCAATTATILASSAMEHPRWMGDNPVGNVLRTLFTSLYIPLYHAMAPMEWDRFRYAQAVAALLRLSALGMMRVQGPETVGYRPEAIQQVTPSVVRLLSRYTARKSGVPVNIEPVRA